MPSQFCKGQKIKDGETWAQLYLNSTTLGEAIASGKVKVEGDQKELALVFDMFDKFDPTKNYLVPPLENDFCFSGSRQTLGLAVAQKRPLPLNRNNASFSRFQAIAIAPARLGYQPKRRSPRGPPEDRRQLAPDDRRRPPGRRHTDKESSTSSEHRSPARAWDAADETARFTGRRGSRPRPSSPDRLIRTWLPHVPEDRALGRVSPI